MANPDGKPEAKSTAPGEHGVHCRRLGVDRSVDDHLSCPYCFGRRAELVTEGQLTRFCDFSPTEDPVCFGFPDDTSRNQRG